MSEQTNTPAVEDETPPAAMSELDMLKERARTLGIPLGGNIGVETLKKKIADKLAGIEENAEKPTVVDATVTEGEVTRPKMKAEIEMELRKSIQDEQLKLVRCKIDNLNPAKADLDGEIITVDNRYLGTVRKFIPFGEKTANGYHVPTCLVNEMRSRQFQHIKTETINGQIKVTTRLVPEFSIVEMPPLTKDELAQLAHRQQAAATLAGAE